MSQYDDTIYERVNLVSDKLQEVKGYYRDYDVAEIVLNPDQSEVVDILLDVVKFVPTLIEQLEQAQRENKELQRRDFVVSKASETLGRYVREAQEERDQLRVILKGVREQNQKLIEALEWYADNVNYEQKPYITPHGTRMFKSKMDEDRNGYRARTVLQEVQS